METELSSMIVRLLGDGSSYANMMQESVKQTQEAADKVVAATSAMEQRATESWKGIGQAALGALSTFGSVGFLKNIFNEYVDQEKVQFRLKAAIMATGREVEPQLARYNDFAKELRALTGASRDSTLSLLAQAESMGLSGANAEKAVKEASDLAGLKGDVAGHWLMAAKAVQENNAQMLYRIPILRGIHDPQEKLAKVQDMIRQGMVVASEQMNTTDAVMNRFYGSSKIITKQLGEFVAEGIKPVAQWLTKLAESFAGMDPVTRRIIVYVAALATGLFSIGPIVGGLTAVLTPVFASIAGGFGMIGTAIGVLASPIAMIKIALIAVGGTVGILTGPIGLVIAAVVLIINKLGGWQATWELVKRAAVATWEAIKTYGLITWEFIKAKAIAFWDYIQPAIERLKVWFDVAWKFVGGVVILAWQTIKEYSIAFWDWIEPYVMAAIDWIVDAWEYLVVKVPEVWEGIKQAVVDFWDWIEPFMVQGVNILIAAWEIIEDVAPVVWDAVVDAAEAAVEFIISAWKGFVQFFDDSMSLLGTLWDDFQNIIMIAGAALLTALFPVIPIIALVAGAVFILIGAWNDLETAATTAWADICRGAELAAEDIKTVVDSIINMHVKAYEYLTGMISGFVDAAIEFFESLPPAVQVVLGAIGLLFFGWAIVVKEVFSKIWDHFVSVGEGTVTFFTAIWDAFTDGVGLAWEGVSSYFGEVWEWIQNVFGDNVTSIKDAFLIAFIAIEFGLKNFKEVAALIWLGVRLKAVEVWDSIKNHFITVTGVFGGIAAGIGAMFGAVWNNLKVGAAEAVNEIRVQLAGAAAAAREAASLSNPATLIERVAEARRVAMQAARDSIASEAGVGTMQNIGQQMGNAYNTGLSDTIARLGGLGPSELQTRLRTEFNAANDAIRGTWEEFRERRLRELGEGFGLNLALPQFNMPGFTAAGTRAGTEAGQATNRAMGNELKKFDATNYLGAEARGRIQAFMASIIGPAARMGSSGGTGPIASGTPAAGTVLPGGAIMGGAGVFFDDRGRPLPSSPPPGSPSSPASAMAETNRRLQEIHIDGLIANRYLEAMAQAAIGAIDVTDLRPL